MPCESKLLYFICSEFYWLKQSQRAHKPQQRSREHKRVVFQLGSVCLCTIHHLRYSFNLTGPLWPLNGFISSFLCAFEWTISRLFQEFRLISATFYNWHMKPKNPSKMIAFSFECSSRRDNFKLNFSMASIVHTKTKNRNETKVFWAQAWAGMGSMWFNQVFGFSWASIYVIASTDLVC